MASREPRGARPVDCCLWRQGNQEEHDLWTVVGGVKGTKRSSACGLLLMASREPRGARPVDCCWWRQENQEELGLWTVVGGVKGTKRSTACGL